MTIYLDHNATTPLAPEVRQGIAECLEGVFGNPSSPHALGQVSRRYIDRARSTIASLINASPDELLFTSGGTEANNLALLGVLRRQGVQGRRSQVLLSSIEHHAVLDPGDRLRSEGFDVGYLPVSPDGVVDLDRAAELITDATALVSVMVANNDIGTIQPVAALSGLAHGKGALLHSDGVQALGKIELDVAALGVDLMSVSAHKIYGPKGIGVLYCRRGVPIDALFYGGHQERGIRPGTENLLGIVGFGYAATLVGASLKSEGSRLASLRKHFESTLLNAIEGSWINGHSASRLPNTTNITLPGVNAEHAAINLDMQDIAVSTGAACSSADGKPSHVLLAMGQSQGQAGSSLRLSLGRQTTADQLERAATAIVDVVARLRHTS